jgi:hypothetical protein
LNMATHSFFFICMLSKRCGRGRSYHNEENPK